MKFLSVVVLVFIGITTAARPPDEDGKDRVVKAAEDLSKQEHFHDGDHNPEYDHEAFVGEDEARKYEELSPEQSKERLGKLVDKIDKNGDGYVSEQELMDWIKYTQNKYIYDDVERQMKTTDLNEDKAISWEEYRNATYGIGAEDSEDFAYKDMLSRDERRFKKADKSGNSRLDKDEFVAFLHPENDPDMKDIIVEETMEDIDKDKDGYLSMDEYIGDMWPADERKMNPDNPPDWVVKEREQYTEFRDKNKDGKMDKDEVRDWILPADYDHVSAEAKHLLTESDENKDGVLSKTEIVEKYDLFVGSQATDFGDALQGNHDEF